jgi:hypothetical protein
MTRARPLMSRLAALPAILVLLGATGFILREGMAELLAIDATRQIAVWESGGALSGPRVEAIERTLQQAISLSPDNGAHREALGTLYFARAVVPQQRSDAGRLLDFDRAVIEYREATRRTTVSGYAWGNLMLAKHYAGQIDAEFSLALRNAARFAPHEAPVQLMLVGTVLPRWTQLEGEARVLAARAVMLGWEDRRELLVAEARDASGRENWCGADPLLLDPSLVAAMRRLCAATDPALSPPAPAARRAP